MTKDELLKNLHEEQARWEALLDQIGEAHMDEPGVAEDWSIKDIVAHLTGWRQRTVMRLQTAQRGAGEPLPPWPAHLQTDDEINDWIYESNRYRSVHEVLTASRQTFQQLVSAITALPEAELLDPQRFTWLEGEPLSAASLFSHFHEEHEPDMRAWLAQQTKTRM